MSEYSVIYKCRLCGESFRDGSFSAKNDLLVKRAVASIAVNGNTEDVVEGDVAHIHSIHCCSNGSVGLADFQGIEIGGK